MASNPLQVPIAIPPPARFELLVHRQPHIPWAVMDYIVGVEGECLALPRASAFSCFAICAGETDCEGNQIMPTHISKIFPRLICEYQYVQTLEF